MATPFAVANACHQAGEGPTVGVPKICFGCSNKHFGTFRFERHVQALLAAFVQGITDVWLCRSVTCYPFWKPLDKMLPKDLSTCAAPRRPPQVPHMMRWTMFSKSFKTGYDWFDLLGRSLLGSYAVLSPRWMPPRHLCEAKLSKLAGQDANF